VNWSQPRLNEGKDDMCVAQVKSQTGPDEIKKGRKEKSNNSRPKFNNQRGRMRMGPIRENKEKKKRK
jgi:hypothetical protein